ncbi:MAG: DUF362 domain-containing protein [Chloroflexi bacterium]|nr:DUF362 domain-containing protein [Chloroflexota bacterium]
MAGFDKVVGLCHFLFDRAPQRVPVVAPKPRRANPWRRNGPPLVSKVKAGDDLRRSIGRAISLLGALGDVISRGDRVMVKPNFNSPDPFPASTDLAFLRTVVQMLLDAGARVAIGESSGGVWRPSRNVLKKLGVYELARSLGVELIAFEDRPRDWVRINVDGDYLRSVTMPRSAYEADKLVYLPCLKTHQLARYSGALKLAFGFAHPGERRGFHTGHLEEKLAEVNLCWFPDLIIMDGRKAFVSGGPDKGDVVTPGLLLASADAVAIDVEAVKTLLSFSGNNRLLPDPWQMPQIAAAVKHGLGCDTQSYTVVESF